MYVLNKDLLSRKNRNMASFVDVKSMKVVEIAKKLNQIISSTEKELAVLDEEEGVHIRTKKFKTMLNCNTPMFTFYIHMDNGSSYLNVNTNIKHRHYIDVKPYTYEIKDVLDNSIDSVAKFRNYTPYLFSVDGMFIQRNFKKSILNMSETNKLKNMCLLCSPNYYGTIMRSLIHFAKN